jgi:hypothetical protein
MARSLGLYVQEKMRLKITLAGSDPAIWRQVEVDSGLTLDDLHYVIQSVFDWQNEHLYHFLVPPEGKLTQKAMRNAMRYDMLGPDYLLSHEDEDAMSRWADREMIGRVFTDKIKQIVYEYDFGDSWEHIVKLEKRSKWEDGPLPARCLAGEMAGPPENCGGIPGYYHWIDQLIADPKDDEARWVLGKNFDEKRFKLEEVNRQLAKVFKPVKPRRRKTKRKSE